MKKHVSFFVAAFLAVAFLLTTQVAALSSPPTGQFTYFYIPPQDGTSTSSLAALNKFLILTHGDETYRSSLRSAGYAGLVLQYLLAAEVDGPGPYANSTAPCNSSFQGHRNQVALDPGDFCTYLHPYESYFLHNSQGQRLYERGWDSSFVIYAMNPAAPGWRSFFIQRALRELQGSSTYPARGFDGLFLDNVWISLWTLTNKMVVNASGYPQEFPSDAAYQAAMAGFLSQLHAALAAHPWPLLGNMASDDYSASSWDAYLPYVDGGMAEAFAADWSTGYPSVSDWLTDLAKAEKVAAQGKTFLAITQGAPSDTSRMRFGYGSYLLVMQPGRTFFRYAKASQGYEYQWSYPDFWTDLGTPVGARFQQADGSWRRNFSRGYVVVNPSTHSAQLVQQAVAPTATSVVNTPTRTATAVPPTATRTATALPPTATRTATAPPPTATRTATAVIPTATWTATAVVPTATSVPPTLVPPTATALPTATSIPPTPTAVPPAPTTVPPTVTATPPSVTATPTTSASTLTFRPVADAYVNQYFPTANYGYSTQLRIDHSPYLHSYLRFNVQGVSGKISKAVLRLYANTSLSTGYVVHAVSNNGWSETTIDWDNAPSVGTAFAWSSPPVAYTWTSVDVSSYITGNGTFTLALTDPSTTALSLASRESTNPPQLIIYTTAAAPAGTPTPATLYLPYIHTDSIIPGTYSNGNFSSKYSFARGSTVTVRYHVADPNWDSLSGAVVSARFDRPDGSTYCSFSAISDWNGIAQGSCTISSTAPTGVWDTQINNVTHAGYQYEFHHSVTGENFTVY